MLVVLLTIATLVVAFGAYRAAGAIRAHRRPTELRGNWWTSFEREFRAYAEHDARSRRRDTRRRGR